MGGTEQGLKDRMSLRIEQLRWSLVELAERTGESYRNVHRWLREDVKVPAHFISRYVEVVPVDSGWLLTGLGHAEPVSATRAQEVLSRVVDALGGLGSTPSRTDLTALAVKSSLIPTALLDAQGRVTTWNPAMEDFTAIPAADAVGRPASLLLDPILGTAVGGLDERLLDHGESDRWTVGIGNGNGAGPTQVTLSWTPGWDSQGGYLGGVLTLRHERELQHLRNLLQETEERYRRLVELNSDPVLVQSGGRIVLANDALRRLLDWGEEGDDLTGTPVQDLIPASEWEWRDASVKEVESGKTLAGSPRTLLRRDGSPVSVEVKAVGVRLNGQVGSQAVLKEATPS